MVCNRCVLAVEDILHSENISFLKVIFGEIQLSHELPQDQKLQLVKRFESIGFELIENRNAALKENIKQLIIKRARNETSEEENRIKLSYYI